MEAARTSLVAADVDPAHRNALPEALGNWRGIVEEAERRVRSGVPLAADSLLALLQHETDAAQRARLDAALRPGGHPRSALLRAVDASRALEAGAPAELAPALLLAAAGLTERLRVLPFADAAPATRAAALATADDDGAEALAQLLLSECAESARARRLAIRRLLRDVADDDDHLAPLGRAAITARRALGVLRRDLATTVPALAVALECSRPAAGDALERLVELGLATEITGRGRDRVFVDALAWRD